MSAKEEIFSEVNHAYETGLSCGIKQAAKLVMEKAIDAFKNEDPHAATLRDLAGALEVMAVGVHPGLAPEKP